MDDNDDACFLEKRVALKPIASKLAPTDFISPPQSQKKTEFLRPAIVI
jgi:hypothetical protein